MAIIKESQGDASTDFDTQYTISVGDAFQGSLDPVNDRDNVRIELTAGTYYEIRLNGVESPDVDLNNQRVTDNGFYLPTNARFIFRPTVSETYYITISSDDADFSGDYEFSVALFTPSVATYDEIADALYVGRSQPPSSFDVVPGGVLTADITALSEDWQQLTRWALEAWTNVTGIKFELVDNENAHITFDDEKSGAYAYSTWSNETTIFASYINLSNIGPGGAEITIYTHSFYIIIHEIGHALGFDHPGPDYGFIGKTFLNDSWQATVMSYFSQLDHPYVDASYAVPITPMIADIIAIQKLYGVPTDIRTGDTVYGYQSNVDGYLSEFFARWTSEPIRPYERRAALTLYDNGGNDTLDLRTDIRDQRVDLRPEGISDVYGLVGNLIIARDTLIENQIAGSGDDRIIGNSAENRLDGGAGGGGDVLRGGPGEDALFGGIGDDVLDGGPDADTLRGGSGIDTVSYEFSDSSGFVLHLNLHSGKAIGADAQGDTFPGRQTIEYVDADGNLRQAEVPDIENLRGSEYGNILTGAHGPNRIEGLGGADDLFGLGGDDVLVGGDGDDNLFGGPGDDQLDGGEEDDELTGDSGTDELDGGTGDDILAGGPGADRLRGGAGSDTAYYRYSDARVEVRLADAVALGGDAEGDSFVGRQTIEYQTAQGHTRQAVVPDIENLRGSEHDDILIGDPGANELNGGGGNDVMDGREGNDRLLGDDSFMIFFGSSTSGDDRLNGGAGDDWLEGGGGADELRGGPGMDTASYRSFSGAVEVRLYDGTAQGGQAEGDTFVGTKTVEYVNTEGSSQEIMVPDIENLFGSTNNDILAGDFRLNWIDGLGGNDLLYGGPDGGPDFLFGGDGDDKVYGGKGDDRLLGGHGDDLLKGGPGTDYLDFEMEVVDRERSNEFEIHFKIERFDYGDDRLEGGAGGDYFYFYPDGGDDVILDFGNGEDRIVLTAFEDIQSVSDLILQQQGDKPGYRIICAGRRHNHITGLQ